MDMKSKFYILVILALVMAIEATPEYPREERTRAQQYFDSIPESDRDRFIRYYLAEGLMENGRTLGRSSRFEAKEIEAFGEPPVDFAKNLVDWTKDEFEMNDDHLEEMLRYDKVCLPPPKGGCYNPGDIGGNCCPY